jgi:hypothetical protein
MSGSNKTSRTTNKRVISVCTLTYSQVRFRSDLRVRSNVLPVEAMGGVLRTFAAQICLSIRKTMAQTTVSLKQAETPDRIQSEWAHWHRRT